MIVFRNMSNLLALKIEFIIRIISPITIVSWLCICTKLISEPVNQNYFRKKANTR